MTMTDSQIIPHAASAAAPLAQRLIQRWLIGLTLTTLVLTLFVLYHSIIFWNTSTQQHTLQTELEENLSRNRTLHQKLNDIQIKLQTLAITVDDTQAQQRGLLQSYQTLNRNHDDIILTEIEQQLTIAEQQLQLTGNPRNALITLQTIDQRLAPLSKMHFRALRSALAQDLAQLKRQAPTNLATMLLKLDQIIVAVDSLTLLAEPRIIDTNTTPLKKQNPSSQAPVWQQGLLNAWHTIKEESLRLLQVKRVDNAGMLLASPEQAWTIREQVKLRLLTARIALQIRSTSRFRDDLDYTKNMLSHYFDNTAPATQQIYTQLKQIQQESTLLTIPSLANSAAAVQRLRETNKE